MDFALANAEDVFAFRKPFAVALDGSGWLFLAAAILSCQHGQETVIAEAGIFLHGKGCEGCNAK